jgi:hypothetical protein
MAAKYGQTCTRVPNDIINFQHDALACAVALGWDEGIEIKELPLIIEEKTEEKDVWLIERIDPAGKPFRIVTKVDGARFSEFWLSVVTKS